MGKEKENRCSWCLGSELYQHYHDTEWGLPCHDSAKLFELICLEGQQAGLSWITILNKREGYRKLFANFDPIKIARFTDAKLDKLAVNPAIVRHRQKVEAIRANAQAWKEIEKQEGSFSDFIWSYVDHKQQDNAVDTLKDVPGSTPLSLQMSKDLKKRGFKFVGATTCYAFMQAAGLVNDHVANCPGYKACLAAAHCTPHAVKLDN